MAINFVTSQKRTMQEMFSAKIGDCSLLVSLERGKRTGSQMLRTAIIKLVKSRLQNGFFYGRFRGRSFIHFRKYRPIYNHQISVLQSSTKCLTIGSIYMSVKHCPQNQWYSYTMDFFLAKASSLVSTINLERKQTYVSWANNFWWNAIVPLLSTL